MHGLLMMLVAADGSCFIQPVLLPGQMTAVASNRDVQSAVGDVLLDCVMLNQGRGGSARLIGKLHGGVALSGYINDCK